jgi:hypothetical protein
MLSSDASWFTLCATLAAQATLIVSGDKHLLDLHPYQGIQILPVAAALKRLEPTSQLSKRPSSIQRLSFPLLLRDLFTRSF